MAASCLEFRVHAASWGIGASDFPIANKASRQPIHPLRCPAHQPLGALLDYCIIAGALVAGIIIFFLAKFALFSEGVNRQKNRDDQ
jgi:hypothetical protein